MRTYQVKLTPMSSFQGLPSSDTLFGAICWGIKRVYDESRLTKILESFQEHPIFILSSSFPYIESNGNHISFYPKPLTPGLSASDTEEIAKTKKEKLDIITLYKKFKKAEYVSSSIFERMLKDISEKIVFEDFWRETLRLEGKMLIDNKGYEDLWKTTNPTFKRELVQKNSIDRLIMSTGEEGQTFYQEEYYTSPAFKLHFLLKTDDIDFFKLVFRYLEDKGIGGNRSTGKGRFKIDLLGELSIGIDESHHFVTLSRYIPDVSELNIESKVIYYELIPYRSKVDSEAEFKGEDIWKAKVMYLKEGSCFEAKERKSYYGRVPVVKEIKGQSIYQNGLAFPAFGNFGGSK